MAVNIYTERDADLSVLAGKTVGIIGYGSQGHAHALNLHDSGVKVLVGLYEGSASRQTARDAGLGVDSVAAVTGASDVIMVAIPDHVQKDVYRAEIEPNLAPGKALMFAHGFTIHYGFVAPPPSVDVMMIAPKAPGHRMREHFVQEGIGVPCLLAVHQDATGRAKETGLAYAAGIGCAKAGVLETTFKDETESDLFGEQSVLCGGVTALINMAFETLVERGYPPEIAYFECLHELKMIVDLIQQGGFNYMRYSVSDTAEYGDLTRGTRVIDESVRANMHRALDDIQSGDFAREWMAECDEGRHNFLRLRQEARTSRIHEVGRGLRELMPWLNPREIE